MSFIKKWIFCVGGGSISFNIYLNKIGHPTAPKLMSSVWHWLVTEKETESGRCSVVSDSLRPHGLYSPWNSPGQNAGVSSLSLLQGSNPGLPHCRQLLYQLSHKGSPYTNRICICVCVCVCVCVYQSEKESEVAQSCPTLCDPIDCSLPASSVCGNFQARILE